MKKTALSIGIAAAFMMGGSSAMAGTISNSDITVFTGGEAAKASEVNGNFDKVKNAVNDNDIRITSNQGAISDKLNTSGLAAAIAADSVVMGKVNTSDLAEAITTAIAADTVVMGKLNTSGLAAAIAADSVVMGKVNTSDLAAAIAADSVVMGKAAASTSGNTIDGNAMNIGSLEMAVGDSNSGLVKDVADLQAGGGCPTDAGEMVQVGPLCVDKYEASVWSDKAATGARHGVPSANNAPSATTGTYAGTVYAVSKSGVLPSVNITWEMALEACANSGKRLLTGAEWSMASLGTVVASCARAELGNTGGACVSTSGVVDMGGNVHEWTGDELVSDFNDIGAGGVEVGTNTKRLLRGGRYEAGQEGLNVYIAWPRDLAPNDSVGFRCAK